MKKSINLSIPTSCAEKWENFTTTSEGGFCGSCSKVVVDFSRLSDAEVLKFFESKPAHTCGRFRPDQLKVYSYQNAHSVRPGLGLLKAGFVSLCLVLADKASAQIKPASDRAPVEQSASAIVEPTFQVEKYVTSSEDNSPLPGVNIFLKGGTVGTVSDGQGKFEFPEKLKGGDVIVFSFIGLDTQEYTVPTKPATDLDIKLSVAMEMSCMVLMGAVAVDETYAEPTGVRKIWLKVKSVF
jgi:CarboxypepD_reg-like domain